MTLFLGHHGHIAVQLCLVQRPDQLFRSLGDGHLRGHYLGEITESFPHRQPLVGDNSRFVHSYRVPFFLLPLAACGARLRRFAGAGLASRFAMRSSLAYISSSRNSMLTARSARLTKSARDGMLNCCLACNITFSTASRKGDEVERYVLSIIPLALA